MLRVRPWAGGSHEGRYVQVLDYNQVVIPHQGRGYLFNPVMAPTHWPDMGTGQLGLSPGSLVRFLLLPGQLLLETYYTPLFPDVQLGCAEHLVVRGGQGGADPPGRSRRPYRWVRTGPGAGGAEKLTCHQPAESRVTRA